MGINDFNKLSEGLTQSVMTVNTLNPILSIKSGKIVGRHRERWGEHSPPLNFLDEFV